MPGSPALGIADRIELSLGDAMILNELLRVRDDSPHRFLREIGGLSDVRSDFRDNRLEFGWRMATEAEQDVCFPAPGMSEIGENEVQPRTQEPRQYRTRRRRGQWPNLSILEEWSHVEKEDRTEERRVERITEPQLIDGRFRPVR
ncbi:CorA metal ion transporter [Fusarium solani]